MKSQVFVSLMLIIVMLSVFPTVLLMHSSCYAETTGIVYVDDDLQENPQANYTSIQDAIDAGASNIYVYPGIYSENIVIEHGVTLTGENKQTTIVDANGNEHVMEVTAENVTITNLTIQNSGLNGMAGILLDYALNCTISNTVIQNNGAHGITMVHSENNNISNNIIRDNINGKGIGLAASNDNIIYNNKINNNLRGIRLETYSTENSIIKNTIENNSRYGIDIFNSNNNIISQNILLNNDQNAQDKDSNYWYTSSTHQGNYWGDYTGTDSDDNGIGDTPYDIPGGDNEDMYVLGFFEELSSPVPDKHPTANIGGPYSGVIQETIHFDATLSKDNDHNRCCIQRYDWKFYTDDSWNNNQGPKVTYAYSTVGNYTVTLRVHDDEGNTATATTTVLIRTQIQPPTAQPGGSYSGSVGESIVFDASQSYDLDGEIVNYTWQFGENIEKQGKIVNQSFSSADTYIVMLTVTDNDGLTDQATTTATITHPSSQNQPPSAYIHAPTSVEVGQTITFDASNSSDSDGNIISYEWNFGDGTNTSTTDHTLTHYYEKEGTYNVSLTVTDQHGKTDTTTTVVVAKSAWNLTLDFPGFELILLFVAVAIMLLWNWVKKTD